jgi:hypothetical protein
VVRGLASRPLGAPLSLAERDTLLSPPVAAFVRGAVVVRATADLYALDKGVALKASCADAFRNVVVDLAFSAATARLSLTGVPALI